MKNPCEECIVRVNCTAVCGEKTNYETLLKHAQLLNRSGTRGVYGYFRYSSLQNQSVREKIKIQNRAERLKDPNC